MICKMKDVKLLHALCIIKDHMYVGEKDVTQYVTRALYSCLPLTNNVTVHRQDMFNTASLLTDLFTHLLGASVRPPYDPCH